MKTFSIKYWGILFAIYLLFCFSFCFVGCSESTKSSTVNIYVDGQKIQTVQMDNFSLAYIQSLKPADITTDPNIKRYFYGWFLDSTYNTPLSSISSYGNFNIYGKWIDVNDDLYGYDVDKAIATITTIVGPINGSVAIVPSYINGFPVKAIGASAFKNQTKFRSIIVCDGIEIIGANAFSGCNSLDSIVLPNSIKEIGENAFNNCSLLKNVTLPNRVTTISNSLFSGCNSLERVYMVNVTNIGSSAFANCENLNNINLSTSLTELGSSAFAGCSSLKSISIPNGVKTIQSSTFENCENLESILLPSSLISIGSYAFSNCSKLASIIIPQSVVSIGQKAFKGCELLTSAKFEITSGWEYFRFTNSKRVLQSNLLENVSTAADVLTRMKISNSANYMVDPDENYYWYYSFERKV